MSTEAVKKRVRKKKADPEEDAVVFNEVPVEAVPSKKARSRKLSAKVSEGAIAQQATTKAATFRPASAAKEEGAKLGKKTSTSKRLAKTSDVDVKASAVSPTSSEKWPTILLQAKAFSHSSRSLSDEVFELVESQHSHDQESSAQSQELPPIREQIEAINATAAHDAADQSLTDPTTRLPSKDATIGSTMPKSSFLDSFFNDAEPAPVPPPQSRQLDQYAIDEPTSPQANVDMISTPASQPSRPPQQQTPSTLPAGYSITESIPQLRRYTTTSFKTLRTSAPSRPAFGASSFKALKDQTQPASTSTNAFSSSKSSATPPNSATQPPKPPPPPKSNRPLNRPIPSATRPPPQPRPLRPTEMPYADLIKTKEYRSKSRRWVSFIGLDANCDRAFVDAVQTV